MAYTEIYITDEHSLVKKSFRFFAPLKWNKFQQDYKLDYQISLADLKS